MEHWRILKTRTCVSLLITAVVSIVGLTLALSQKPSTSVEAKVTTPPVRPIVGPPPYRHPVIGKYLGSLSVREPEEYEGLSIFPLIAESTFPLHEYLTLDEALKSGDLRVTEVGEGAQVNTLQLENASDHYVFIMSGEILMGAKQDRTMQNDVLVPPHSGKILVKVFCTEHGRWVAQTGSFEAAGAAVPNSVRSTAAIEKEQVRVWDTISANQSKLKVAAPTRAAKEVYAAPQVQKEMGPFLDKLSDIPTLDPRAVGVAAAYGNRIIAIDIFGDSSLFHKLYPKLLRSYVVDVIGDPWKGTLSVKEIAQILSNAAHAPWQMGKTDGVGAELEFHQEDLHGSALLYKEMAIHSDLFVSKVRALEKEGLNENNQSSSPPPNLRFRREHRVRE